MIGLFFHGDQAICSCRGIGIRMLEMDWREKSQKEF
jgi:hypothetical protein